MLGSVRQRAQQLDCKFLPTRADESVVQYSMRFKELEMVRPFPALCIRAPSNSWCLQRIYSWTKNRYSRQHAIPVVSLRKTLSAPYIAGWLMRSDDVASQGHGSLLRLAA